MQEVLILSEIQELLKDIDTLKKNLNELIEKKNFNLQDSEIIKASQELNIAISKYNDLIVKKL
jgi:hypothetical protein